MQTQTAGKSVDEIVAAVEALDLEPIKFKVTHPEGDKRWSREHAEYLAREYKRFLTLLVKYPDDTIAPTNEVDEFWHMHILDTRKYAEDCQNIFGYFLHHFPYFGMRSEEDAKDLERAGNTWHDLYAREFGDEQEGAHQIKKPAYCYAGLKAAYCYAAVKADRQSEPAYCYAAIESKAAYCYAAVKPAYCYAGVKTVSKSEPAYCYAAVESKAAAVKPAYCYAGVKTVSKSGPAYCYAAVQSKERSKQPAYCYAAIKAA